MADTYPLTNLPGERPRIIVWKQLCIIDHAMAEEDAESLFNYTSQMPPKKFARYDNGGYHKGLLMEQNPEAWDDYDGSGKLHETVCKSHTCGLYWKNQKLYKEASEALAEEWNPTIRNIETTWAREIVDRVLQDVSHCENPNCDPTIQHYVYHHWVNEKGQRQYHPDVKNRPNPDQFEGWTVAQLMEHDIEEMIEKAAIERIQKR